MVNLIAEPVQDWRRLDERIAAVSAEIESLAKQDEGCQQVMTLPGLAQSSAIAMAPASNRDATSAPGWARTEAGMILGVHLVPPGRAIHLA